VPLFLGFVSQPAPRCRRAHRSGGYASSRQESSSVGRFQRARAPGPHLRALGGHSRVPPRRDGRRGGASGRWAPLCHPTITGRSRPGHRLPPAQPIADHVIVTLMWKCTSRQLRETKARVLRPAWCSSTTGSRCSCRVLSCAGDVLAAQFRRMRYAVSQPTVWARVAAFVAIAAGIVAGLEVAGPWLPIGLIVAALALWVAGRRSEAQQRQSTGA